LISLNEVSLYGGNVFCLASLDPKSHIPTSNQILSSGYGSKFAPNQFDVNVTVSNLIPSNAYVSYCLLILSDGRISSPDEIAATQREWNTKCCKRIQFTSVPSVFYRNSSIYHLSKERSEYTSVFALSSLLSSPPGRSLFFHFFNV
jgi:hypothetical protein